MKNFKSIMAASLIAAILIVVQGCSFSTANLSSLKTSKDKEGKSESTSFDLGDTLNAKAQVSNNPGSVKVKFSLTAEDVKGMAKGETLKGSDVTAEVQGDGFGAYSVPVSEAFPEGSYKLTADMMNESGEKKDSKSVMVKISHPAE